MCVPAYGEQPDSIQTHELHEVVIEAPRVIHKADMDVYHPSKSAIANSKNGMQLLTHLITASGYVQYRMERMRGTGYSHNNNAWSGNVSVELTHWGFVLSAQYRRAERDLWGEKISWGEDLNIIDLSYNWKSWQFGAGIIMPFGKYDQGSRSISRWNRNEQHMRLDMRMPYITVGYNLQWGRQKRGARKLVDVNADADRSTAGGR